MAVLDMIQDLVVRHTLKLQINKRKIDFSSAWNGKDPNVMIS